MSRNVYITRLSTFLPNDPVSNDEMEAMLGMINDKPSKARAIVLRNNGIKTRYYSFDKNGRSTHSNAQLAREAILKLCDEKFTLADIQMLGCGTTTPDVILPSHASMVLGELGAKPMEIMTPGGSCCTGVQALNYCYLSVLAGNYDNAVCVGSEKLSGWIRAERYKEEAERLRELEDDPMLAFEKEFLRWMLSDGAGACVLETQPAAEGLSYRIEWIEQRSYANELPVCMYIGGTMDGSGAVVPWSQMDTKLWGQQSAFALKQDARLLADNIVPYGGKFLKDINAKRGFDASTVDYFLPHLSSEFFASRIAHELKEIGMEIPAEKWFYNLTRVGNIGAASPFVMLDELRRTGRAQAGHKVLIMVPESARFSYAYVLLTVV